MFYLDTIIIKNSKNDDKNWPYRMQIIGPSRSGKTNALLNLIQKQNNNNPIDKIYLYAKDLSEPKYQFLIEKRENAGKRIIMTQLHLLSIQTLWMRFTAILMIIVQNEREKFLLCLMIWLLIL